MSAAPALAQARKLVPPRAPRLFFRRPDPEVPPFVLPHRCLPLDTERQHSPMGSAEQAAQSSIESRSMHAFAPTGRLAGLKPMPSALLETIARCSDTGEHMPPTPVLRYRPAPIAEEGLPPLELPPLFHNLDEDSNGLDIHADGGETISRNRVDSDLLGHPSSLLENLTLGGPVATEERGAVTRSPMQPLAASRRSRSACSIQSTRADVDPNSSLRTLPS